MKIKYTLFFKSGSTNQIIQDAPEKEIQRINDTITEAFADDMMGVLTFGEKGKRGIIVRIDDLSMVEIEEIE